MMFFYKCLNPDRSLDFISVLSICMANSGCLVEGMAGCVETIREEDRREQYKADLCYVIDETVTIWQV